MIFLYESFKCIVKQSLDSIGEVHSKSLLHRFVVDFQKILRHSFMRPSLKFGFQ